MIALLRIIVILFYFVFVCIYGIFYCLIYFKNKNNVMLISKLLSKVSIMLGIKIRIYQYNRLINNNKCVYIANHQNIYDLFIISCIIQNNTVTIGKKEIIFIPLFGILYWLSGNISIHRNTSYHSFNNLNNVINNIKKRNISVLVFPEGTRSNSKKMLPFKTGAFYIAVNNDMPIVPICVSNTNNIKLNRWNNGIITIYILPKLIINNYKNHGLREITKHCFKQMKNKLDIINNY
ncbi:MAG: 1-acylglycerol-3-phosphate O-acyltransferase [Candidatus Lightella neohaematopini]|nr:1-acylglycerol-3-phosphate O-acyltransferase [Candidatus Lightella neohaematopini]MCV2529036.1 1-acylglycerol-3-phosphate O-acyltransferase [Candidatus Lightella neohaematopini]